VTASTIPYGIRATDLDVELHGDSFRAVLRLRRPGVDGAPASASAVGSAYALAGVSDEAGAVVDSGDWTGSSMFERSGSARGLPEATAFILVGAALGSTGESTFAARDAVTRTRPVVHAARIAVSRGTAVFSAKVSRRDPLIGRANDMSAAWTIVPAGTASVEWLAPRDGSDPPPIVTGAVPAIPVGEARNLQTDSGDALYTYSLVEEDFPGALEPERDYAFVLWARDWYLPDDERDVVVSVPFRTRAGVSLALELADPAWPGVGTNPGANHIVVRAVAGLPDAGALSEEGSRYAYSVRVMAVRLADVADPTDVGEASERFERQDSIRVADGAVDPVDAVVRFGGTAGALLSPGTEYVVFALAEDATSGDLELRHLVVTTEALAPRVSVKTSAETLEASTLYLEASNLEIGYTLYGAAYLVPDSVGAPDVSTPEGRAAHKANAGAVGGAVVVLPARPGYGPIEVAMTFPGLLPGSAYSILVLAEAPDGKSSSVTWTVATVVPGSETDVAAYDDGLWDISWSAAKRYTRPVRGAPLGSGCIRARPSLGTAPRAGLESISVSAPPAPHHGRGADGYLGSVLPGFDPTGFTFDDPAMPLRPGGSPVCTFAASSQTLNMHSAVCTTRFDLVVSAAAVDAGNPQALRIRDRLRREPGGSLPGAVLEVFLPRTMPQFTSASLSFSVAGGSLEGLMLYQTMTGPADAPAEFDGGAVYSPQARRSVFVTTGVARDGRGRSRACASAVLFSDGFREVRALGANAVLGPGGVRAPGGVGFAAFSMYADDGADVSVTVLSAHLSGRGDDDVDDLRSQARRALLTAIGAKSRNGLDTDGAAALALRRDHALAWAAAWRATVEIVPREVDAAELATVREVRRFVRQSQYTLLSSVPEAGAVPGRAFGSPGLAADPDGMLALARELWVIPALTYLRPRLARAMLSARFDELEAARDAARAHGLDGARFQHPGHAAGLRDAPYYDLASAGSLFPSCLVAIGAWKYFLANQDQEWLVSRGYSILSGVADMLASAAEVSYPPPDAAGVVQPSATFGTVLDLAGDSVPDGAFTVHTAKQALRAAIEASRALRYPTRNAWIRAHDAIALPLLAIPAPEAASGTAAVPLPFLGYSDAADRTPSLLDPLVVLTQHWADPYGPVPMDSLTLRAAERHFHERLAPEDVDIGANLLTRAAVRSQADRHRDPAVDPDVVARTNATFDLLLHALRTQRVDVWGGPARPVPPGRPAPDPALPDDDPGLAAQVLLVFITAFAGLRVEGGFTVTGTTYQPLGIRASAAGACLPTAWSAVRVRTERDHPMRLSTGASGGQVLTEELVVSNLIPPSFPP
jgi:hypothetical protein